MTSDNDVGEFYCPECGRRCTRGPSGLEYGHNRNTQSRIGTQRCPRRPAAVDCEADREQT